MDTIEEIVFSHHTVHVFKIPPQKTSAGHKYVVMYCDGIVMQGVEIGKVIISGLAKLEL